MPQQVTQKPTVLFNKGLITEAGELTFPEGASVDELNCDLQRDGSRKRRLGLKYETNYELGPDHLAESTTSINLWENAGGVAGLTFIVVQLGATLYFYYESEGSISSNKKSFSVDLTTFARPTGFGASTRPIQTAVIEGILVVASSEINTFKIEYDDGTDSVTATQIEFKIRDFEFQGDIEDYREPSTGATVSIQREYDTKNSGWNGNLGAAALTDYITSETAYPPLSLPWYSGKDSSGDFDVAEFNKIYTGTSLIANGSYILDLYEQDRQTAASLSTNELNYTETSRFKTVTAFAGRIFYAGMSNKYSNKVFFSKLLYQTDRLGDCYGS